MTGLVRKATLLTLCSIVVAGVAAAGVPSSATSSLPPGACFKLVGRNLSGTADPSGAFTITVRDIANNAVANSNVVIDFSSCPDVHVAVQANQPVGVLVTPAQKRVSTTSNSLGQANFTIVGGGTNGGGGGATLFPGSGFGCATVTADNQPLGTLTVALYDENNVGNITTTDLAEALGDTFNTGAGATLVARTDEDCNHSVNSADLSVLLGVTFGTFIQSASANAW